MTAPTPLRALKAGPLTGTLRVPGDKSLSHRALLFGALAVGETTIEGLLEGEDVLGTARIIGQLGAEASRGSEGRWHVHGVGTGGLREPADVLDFGNSGTGARLCLGLCASHPFTAIFTGDASLRNRPMRRVLDPLEEFGARAYGRLGGTFPLALVGARNPAPVTYALPVASAQVKSAVLLAGLGTPGRTSVIERTPTRDHTERLLKAFGAQVRLEDSEEGQVISVDGFPELLPQAVTIPGDPSSAAFLAAAAALIDGSDILIENVLINPTRTGFFETLSEMGAPVTFENERVSAGEPVADVRVRSASLRAVSPPPARAPRMIDEFPILFVLAAFAEGRSHFTGLEELRVKESDRLAAMAAGLTACGARLTEHEDGLEIEGAGALAGGATIATHLDHRIAMSFLVAGLAAKAPITIDDARMIATSFPSFTPLLEGLGATFEEPLADD
ncbi:MAG: 3-phosphoshikimate 1-carboxyvinyltransferase [Pseudomonadota bacterium]